MRKPNKQDNEVSYWESMADGVIGLLLCVLLILMLLILYLVKATDELDLSDNDDYGNNASGYGSTHEHDWDYADPGAGGYDDDDSGGGGGNGGSGNPYEDPDPGRGEGEGSGKAAVLVQVIDGETQRTIKKQGIEFELYNTVNALQVLSTYYPVKIDYKKYETDKEGMFYLPEKIWIGTYYLDQLTPVEGYDRVQDWEFSPDRDYDWPEPYLVNVELFPSKNIVRIKLRDRETGNSLTGASFEIVAAENIVTKDGTTRYKSGEIADTVEVDEEGYAESKELYLGKYLIRQKTAPEYYSSITNDTAVQVKSKSVSAVPPLNELSEQKTSIQVLVTDALYDNQSISGAVLAVTTGSGERVGTITTDETGKAVVTNLKKGFTYHIKQSSSARNYKTDPGEYSFTVTDKGLINGKEVENLVVKNAIIRVAFGVRDRLFGGQLSDINITLLDNNGKIVQSWNTSAVGNVIEGLVPGEYRVVINGDESHAYPVVVKDVIEVQHNVFSRWTTLDIACMTGAVLAAAGVCFIVIWLRKRKKQA